MGKSGKSLLLIVSFLEGGSLMAFEVLSAKIYTPYLGASIYVWTSILTVTLIGLAAGYWLGGRMSLKNARKGLTISLAGAAVFVLTSTFIASSVLPTLLSMNVKTAAIIAGFLILFLPVFLMGTVSPLIIGILNQLNSKLSAATGLIFGLGTVGGILFLLLTVFLLIPSLGVRNSSFILGVLLLFAAGLSTLVKSTSNEKE